MREKRLSCVFPASFPRFSSAGWRKGAARPTRRIILFFSGKRSYYELPVFLSGPSGDYRGLTPHQEKQRIGFFDCRGFPRAPGEESGGRVLSAKSVERGVATCRSL
jgi:hypothetical protein